MRACVLPLGGRDVHAARNGAPCLYVFAVLASPAGGCCTRTPEVTGFLSDRVPVAKLPRRVARLRCSKCLEDSNARTALTSRRSPAESSVRWLARWRQTRALGLPCLRSTAQRQWAVAPPPTPRTSSCPGCALLQAVERRIQAALAQRRSSSVRPASVLFAAERAR